MTDTDRPHELRADHLTDPVGIGPATPRLSWKLPGGATSQNAYRIVAGDWDSGRVESPDPLFAPVEVSSASGLQVEWKVQVWTDLGESAWSETASWEHGLLHPSDWTADWIAPVERDDLPARQRPAYHLAGWFRIDGEVASARLSATAHGLYEAFINGTRVGDLELTPGWTAYRSHIQVQTYDVTDLLTTGANVVGALVSDGWWRGQNSVSRRVDDYGTTVAFLAQLVVTLTSGETVTFGTDDTWRGTPSHILRADLIAGEVHDLRRRADWSAGQSGEPVRVEDHGYAELCGSPAPPVRRVEELTPASVRELSAGRWIVDLGQNISGWLRLTNLGPAGTELTLTYGEWLDKPATSPRTTSPTSPPPRSSDP